MSANTVKIVGSALAVAVAVLGHYGVVPVNSELTGLLAGLVTGWLHIQRPGEGK